MLLFGMALISFAYILRSLNMDTKRIVHCANFNLQRLKGCFMNSLQVKLNNGLIRNGHSVFAYPDRDALRMYSWTGHMSRFALKKANHAFLKYCLTIKPDGLILSHADTIFPQTIAEIREKLPNLRVLQYNVDNITPGDNRGNVPRILSKIDVVDATLVTTADIRCLNALNPKQHIVGFIPNAVDKSLEKAKVFEKDALAYDLICAVNPKTEREFCGSFEPTPQILKKISEHTKELKVLFPQADGDKLDGSNYQSTLEECAMGVNLSHVNSDYLYSSDRMAHLMGNGILAFVDKATGFSDLFTDNEIAFYQTEEELYDKIKFYHRNSDARKKVAQSGWEKYHALFNETLIAKYVMELMFGVFKKENYPWPTIV